MNLALWPARFIDRNLDCWWVRVKWWDDEKLNMMNSRQPFLDDCFFEEKGAGGGAERRGGCDTALHWWRETSGDFFFFFFDTLCVLTHAGSNKWCWSWGEAPKTWIQLPRMLQHRWGSQSVTEAAATGRAERCHLLIGLKTEDYQQITMSCRAEADR